MSRSVKFATQIDEEVLKDLKSYAEQCHQTISTVVSTAVSEYLDRARLKLTFYRAMDDVLDENEELLKLLAK